MDSFVVCVDNSRDMNNLDSSGTNWSNARSLVDLICYNAYLADNRNKISIRLSSPPKTIRQFTANRDEILKTIDGIVETKSNGSNQGLDVVQCLWFAYKQLQTINCLRKTIILLVRTFITSKAYHFSNFINILNKECSQIAIDVILFGDRTEQNQLIMAKLVNGAQECRSRVSTFVLMGKTVEHMARELVELGFLSESVVKQKQPIDTLMDSNGTKSALKESLEDVSAVEDSELKKAMELSLLDSVKDINDRDRAAIAAALSDLDTFDSVPASPGFDSVAGKTEIGISSPADDKSVPQTKPRTDVNSLKEKLNKEDLDPNTKDVIKDAIKQTEESLSAINTASNDTEDDISKAIRLSLMDICETKDESTPDKANSKPPPKKKIIKFKEGNKDD